MVVISPHPPHDFSLREKCALEHLSLKGKAWAAFLFFLQYRVTGKPHSGQGQLSVFVPHLGQVMVTSPFCFLLVRIRFQRHVDQTALAEIDAEGGLVGADRRDSVQ